MAESADDNAKSEKSERAAGAPQDNTSVDKNLPMVVAPKLGSGEDEMVDETPEPAGATVSPAAHANSTRFLMLAATVAFAAAFGSFIGSVSGSGMARYVFPAEPSSGAAIATASLPETNIPLAELLAIKSTLDTTARNTVSQFTKISERLDKLDAHTTVAPETTGSISAPPQPADAPKIVDRILQDWVVQDVRNGRALVENRYGGIFDVGTGSILPGVGHVDAVKRQDGQWLVLTARGTITSGP
jgi:hypothetical protein